MAGPRIPPYSLESSNVLFDLVAWMTLPLVGALSFFNMPFFVAIYVCTDKVGVQ